MRIQLAAWKCRQTGKYWKKPTLRGKLSFPNPAAALDKDPSGWDVCEKWGLQERKNGFSVVFKELEMMVENMGGISIPALPQHCRSQLVEHWGTQGGIAGVFVQGQQPDWMIPGVPPTLDIP